MQRKKVSTTIYLDPEQHESLKALSARTGVPFAAFIRHAIDHSLAKWNAEARAGKALSLAPAPK